jgi:hypothetical protein
VDPGATEVHRRARELDGVGAASDSIATLDDHDVDAAELQSPRRDQSGHAGSHHDHSFDVSVDRSGDLTVGRRCKDDGFGSHVIDLRGSARRLIVEWGIVSA